MVCAGGGYSRVQRDDGQHDGDPDGPTHLACGVDERAGDSLLVVGDTRAAGDRAAENDVGEPDDVRPTNGRAQSARRLRQ